MRDIVPRRVVRPTNTPPPPGEQPLPSAQSKKGFLVRLFEFFNHGLVWSHATEYTIITPQRASPPPRAQIEGSDSSPEPPPSPKHKYALRGQLKKAGNRLKTTHAQVAVVQTVAIAVLFVFVLSQQPGKTVSQTDRSVSTALQGALRQYLPTVADATPEPFQETTVSSQKDTLPLHAWVTPWSLDTIASNNNLYSSLSVFWLTVATDGSTLQTKSDWKTWDNFRAAHARSDQQLYLTVTGDPDNTILALTKPEVEQQLIANLLTATRDHGFNGIDIDFEALGSTNRDAFTKFIRDIATAFHADNKLLAVTLEARIANQVPMDWHAIGLVADEVRIMAYDYHGRTTAEPGPVSPLGWVKEVTDYAVQQVKASKVIIGLGNYGYDWASTTDATGNVSWQGTGISYERATTLASDHTTPVLRAAGIDSRGYDIGTIPYFTYLDDQNVQHEVWFEDKNSLQEKVNLLKQYPIAGVIFWSVGLGDQGFWTNPSS